MRNFLYIVKYTVVDIINQKSFFVLLAVSIGFLLLLRGCYSGNYVVNGKSLDSVTVAWHASIIAFHIVAGGVLLIAAILSMNLLSRDRDDGTVQYMLSKPLARITYVAGRAVGIWLVSFAFMFVLHLTIFVITLISAGGAMPGYLAASCLCSVNVLFMVLLVCTMSLFMPDFAAAMVGIGVVAVSFVADSLFHAAQSRLGQALLANHPAGIPGWEMVWPKVCSMQYCAVSLIKGDVFRPLGSVHPVLVMAGYVCLAAAGLAFAFQRKEI
jgi:ABC-type transport system involved in multi-copper enzyme maturation permease subunit